MKTTDRFKDAAWLNETFIPICVGGVGGIGSNFVYFASKSIRGTFYCFDPDLVETQNIGTQFFTKSQLDQYKVNAISQTVLNFNSIGEVIAFPRKIGENIANIAISAFDNMDARKEMFNSWKKLRNKELFIDGRLSATIYQIYVVTPGEREEWYEKTLFEDSAVEDAPCTFKQTAHFAGLIGARMVHILTNYLGNKYTKEDIFLSLIHI